MNPKKERVEHVVKVCGVPFNVGNNESQCEEEQEDIESPSTVEKEVISTNVEEKVVLPKKKNY